jgi:hypothetical protein
MMFDRVLDQYPDSSEAELARKAIDLMTSKDDSTSQPPE